MKLVERDNLLERLADLLDRAGSGAGHVVLLGGEAGIGKTSLLTALRERAGATTWWGACDALETPHPLAPLHDIARGANAGFGTLLSGEAERIALFQAVLGELQAPAQPLLFVVEDAHWADEATLDLLKFIGRRIGQTRCLLVVSYRDDEVDAAHPLRGVMGVLPHASTARLVLSRLSAAAVDEMARNALRSSDGIHALTQGNPFFVSEVLRHGIEGVPSGVQDLVLARYARLPQAAQAVVRLASLVPARIERWLVDALLAPGLDTLEECLNSGLLVATSESLAFRHELARVAVESSLPPTLAQDLHARVLAALESDPRADTPLARRAHHAARAGDSAAVTRLAPQAAQQAQQRGAHKEAAAHLRTALAHADGLADAGRARLLDSLSYENYVTDRLDEAIDARAAAQRLWHAIGDGLREGDALRWLSRLSWYNGRSADSEAYAEQAIAVLEPLPPGSELAMAYSNRGQLHMLSGSSIEAQEWSQRALALARTLGDRDIEVHALNNLGSAMLNIDDPAGRGMLERSLALALENGFDEHAARAYTNLSYYAGLAAHDNAVSHDYLELGIAYCEQHDLDAWSRYMCAHRAETLMWRGEWDRAGDQAEAVANAPGVAPISRIPALVVLGRLRTRRGDPAARQPLEEALRLAQPTGSFLRLGPVAAALAEAAWLEDDVAAIARAVQLAGSLASQSVYLRWISGELAYWLWRAGAAFDGDIAWPAPYALQFAGRWREAAAAWQALECPYEAARALSDGDSDAQCEALALFERLGARADAERLRRQLQAAGVRGLPRGVRASTQANPHGLTSRELEVLALLCNGMRNAQIAERLHRSVRTVDHHLAAVFAKLGVGTRAEAIAAAHAAGLAGEK